MDVQVSFSAGSIGEAERMLRKWYAWPLFLIRNIYGLALVAGIVFAGGSLFVRSLFSSRIDGMRAALGLFLVLGPCTAFWWLYQRENRKQAKVLAAINPLRLTVDSTGIHTFEKNGASRFSPWSVFNGFREGRTVFLLREAGSGQHRVIPRNGLSADLAEKFKSIVSSKLPEIK